MRPFEDAFLDILSSVLLQSSTLLGGTCSIRWWMSVGYYSRFFFYGASYMSRILCTSDTLPKAFCRKGGQDQ